MLSHISQTICVEKLDGKCQIKHFDQIEDIEKYKDEIHNFYVRDKSLNYKTPKNPYPTTSLRPDEIRRSKQSEIDAEMTRLKKLYFAKHGSVLKTLELFVGVGGMSTGLELSDAIETKWAVEVALSAAKTFKLNHPKACVYNEDVNAVLARAVKQEAGISADDDEKDTSGQPVEAVPQKGDVDLIVMGPPCKGYSSFNHNPKSNDSRNTLILAGLSCVDHYRPLYFLLENVQKFLNHRVRWQLYV